MARRDVDLSLFTDPLTGLPSARVWGETLAWAVEHAREGRSTLSVVLIDLDRFDVLAEADPRAADRLLKAIASSWFTELDDTGLIARLFSGRFGFVLAGYDIEDCIDLVDALRPLMPAGFTCSAGIALWGGEDVERLATRADTALVAAKLHGRDRSVVAA